MFNNQKYIHKVYSTLFSKTNCVTLFIVLFLTSEAQSQVQLPSMGQFPSSQPISNLPKTPSNISIGATADDIQRKVNATTLYYGYQNNNDGIQEANEAWIKSQMMRYPAYNPSLRTPTKANQNLDKPQELFTLLYDIAKNDYIRQTKYKYSTPDYTSSDFLNRTKSFTDALRILTDMLNGKRGISLKEAYYTIENAYGEAYLSNQEYNTIITKSTNFIKEWMKQNKYDIHNNEDIHHAIQQFLSQKLSIIKNNAPKKRKNRIEQIPVYAKSVIHIPFIYDFNDFSGEKDHRNFFLTKCLATGTGQCNSLPAVYLVLAEALGAEAYLSLAPQHSFIKYHGNSKEIQNYEPTSNWKITDQWYIDNMFINKKAINSGIYLSPLSKKQVIADCIIQLAYGYYKKFGIADGSFTQVCIKVAQSQFPKNNNISIYFTYSNLYASQLVNVMRKNGIHNISEIEKSPETKTLYNKLKANEEVINALGYQDIPKEMYEQMMKEHEFKGKIQNQNNVTGKEKQNQFIEN